MLMCGMDDGEMRFVRVSKSFERITGYAESEVLGSPLIMLIPKFIRPTHNQRVTNWLMQGRSSDENAYVAVFTHFVSKADEEVKVFVSFKVFIDMQSQGHLLRFMGLIHCYLQKEEEVKE